MDLLLDNNGKIQGNEISKEKHFYLHRDLQESLVNEAPEEQWEKVDARGHLERKVVKEQRGHMAQRG